MTKARTEEAENRSYAFSVSMIVVTLLVAVISIFAIIFYINHSVFIERQNYLSAQLKTSAELVNMTFSRYSDYIDVCSAVAERELGELGTINEFFSEAYDEFAIDGARFLLVDSSGTWYGSDGTTGRMTEISKYESSTPDKLVYVTRTAEDDGGVFVYRRRLKNEIRARTASGEVTIRFCAAVCSMEQLEKRVFEAFPYDCNINLFDEDGLIVFSQNAFDDPLSGTDIITRLKNLEFLHGDTAAGVVQIIKDRETAVSEFKTDGENYFTCISSMNINNWYIACLIPSDTLTAGDYFRTVSLYMLVLLFILIASIFVMFMFFTRFRRSQNLLSAQQQVNIMLEHASRTKSTFLSNMSHDIRTPINGIMGMTMLAQKENNPPKTEECLENIDRASRHLLSLVNDVLDMSSIESGKTVITTAPVDVIDMLRNCSVILEGQLQGRDLDIITEHGEMPHPYLMIDELHMQQIIINIMSNAIKYTPDGGSITVRVSELPLSDSSSNLHLEFEDTGIGMTPEFVDHIWDAFSQEHGGTRTKYKGTGLGMAITKNFVELMYGTIEVESEFEKGSKFTVEIPFEHAQPIEKSESEDEHDVSIEGVRILLADDNEMNLIIAEELLADEGAVITTAVDGKEALDIFSDNPPGTFDAIILDMMMPMMTGTEAAVAIRALPRPDAAEIPIFAMTANAFEEDIKATHDAGMNEHFSKPIDLPTVLKTISRYCRKGE